jgi:ketosteroid isomerase-like protein/uncharacterized protein YndB with AHSA1/START domain
VTHEPDDAPAARSIDLEIEVPGTPEEVWAAIATGPGITAWLHPTEVEAREGGRFSFDMGSGPTHGTVTAWEPPRRFGQEVEWQPASGIAPARLATEWVVEARAGGTCVVRMVMSGFGTTAGWDDELDGMADGMRAALESLRRHLELTSAGSPDHGIGAVFAAVPVRDLDAAESWYERLLGRPADARPMAGLAEWHLGPAGSIQLVADPGRAGGGLATLEVADLRRHAAALADRGLTGVDVDATTSETVLFATVADPDANAITLVERRDAATAPEAGVRGALAQRAAAFAGKDAGALADLYAGDAALFELAPPLRFTGLDRDGVEAWFAGWSGPVEREARDLRVAVDGDVAFAHGLARMSGRRSDGTKTTLWFRETVGLRRTGGRWAVVHEHMSVPFEMDGTDRARIDLEP